MKKRMIYFIFFIVLCFVIRPCNYKAYQLDCEYKIDNNGKSHYLWLHFERENVNDKWKIRYNEKNEYDAWYQINGVDNNPKSLKGYNIVMETLGSVCPTVAQFDMDNKRITLSNDIYILKTQKRVQNGTTSRYECDYQNSIETKNGLRKTYNIHFTNENNIYKFSKIYRWDSETNKAQASDRKVDTDGLIYIDRTNNGEKSFDDLACPPIAIDDGTTVKLESYELYNLYSTEKKDNKLVCHYNRKTDVNEYTYEIKFEQDGAAVWHTQRTTNQPAKDVYIGKISNLESKSGTCPITFKVKIKNKEENFSFPNVAYFYSTSIVPTSEEQKNQNLGGCSGYTSEKSCEHNKYYSCIWNENEFGTYCNTDKLIYVQCGDSFDIPYQAPKIISLAVNLLKIATPIILIIVSIIALLKAISASNEDEIKKAQKGIIRKIIAAVMVFFVISIVQFVVLKVADTDNSSGASEADNLSTCLSCFLNNDCEANVYYKTSVFKKFECTYLKSRETFDCN